MTENRIEDYPGQWSDVGWRPPAHLSFEVYEAVYSELRADRKAKEADLSTSLWRLADCLNNGEAALGHKFAQLLDARAMTKESAIKVRRLAEEFPISERWSHAVAGVSFWTHWEVVRLPMDARRRLLKVYSEEEDYSRDDLRNDVRAILKPLGCLLNGFVGLC